MKNEKIELSAETKEIMRESAHSLVEIMILEEQPFKVVLWNNDNWDKPLPEAVMEAYPIQLLLEIKEMTLEDSYVNVSTGEIIISTVFNNQEYSKLIEAEEIIAVLDLNGQPYIVNDFSQDKEVEHDDIIDSFMPKSVDDLVELAMSDGIPEENAKKSIDAFMKNNPELQERFK